LPRRRPWPCPFPSPTLFRSGEPLAGPTGTPGVAAGPGLATSATTRRAGIVANTDVAPTVLAALGVAPPPGMAGRPLAGVSLAARSEEHTSELQSRENLVCRL